MSTMIRVLFTLMILLLGFSFSTCSASAAFISTSALATNDQDQEPNFSTGRALLQALKPCTIDFEHQNYTTITSKCKGPRYNATLCCPAFVEFACPFTDQINDQSTDCARNMFSYIDISGKYPPGLFATECKGSKRGLECPQSSHARAMATCTHHVGLLLLLLLSASTILPIFS